MKQGNNKHPLWMKASLKLIELWLSSCRLKVKAHTESKALLDSKKQVIVALWHCGLIYILFHFRKYPAAIMVSGSKDGEWVARAIGMWGQTPVRGSKMKGGLKAIREMTSLLKEKGINAGIVADGSKGPAFIAQKGAIVLARDTGLPIIPVGMMAQPAYKFNTWDKLILPFPLSKVCMVYEEPMLVKKDARGIEIEESRKLLELKLNRAMDKAKEYLNN